MDNLTNEDIKRYATDALNNPVLQDILKQMDLDAVNAWSATEPHNTEARERAWYQHQAASELRQRIDNLKKYLKTDQE